MAKNFQVPLMATSALAIAVAAVTFNQPEKVQAKSQPVAEETKVFTYADDIAEILNNRCITCHRPGEAAPMSFVGYENAKKWSDMISVVTKSRRMPPWKAVPADVEYLNDNHLTDEEIAIFQAWADADAPRGNKANEPTPPTFPEGWSLGKPDLLIEMPYEFNLPADGDDEYWNFVISPDITEPVWVSAIDVEPGNRQIVHHVIAFLDKNGKGKKLVQGKDGDKKSGYKSQGGGVGFMPDGSFGGWAPGVAASRLPDDAGFLLEPGTDIILQMHYNKSGKPEKDQTKVALYTNKNKVTNPVEIAWVANPFINIKPGLADQTFTQKMKLPAGIKVYSVMPHMHLLGRSMKATATLPNGEKIKLVDVPDWDFNWQLVYQLKEPLNLPKGTEIIVEASYDNSVNNPFQPHDPPKRVTWGEETKDEMMLLVVSYAPWRQN